MRNTTYSTQLAKGTGMIDETLALLTIFKEGMDKAALQKYVLDTNYLATSTDLRAKDIVGIVFHSRFMAHNPKLPVLLQQIRNKGLQLKSFTQLLMLYSARQHAVMYDFIIQVLNTYKKAAEPQLPAEAIRSFISQLVAREEANWSETMQKKNAGYVRSTLIDFGFIDTRNRILPYEPADFTILYLMHELHFAGVSDMAIPEHEDWQLFNMDRQAVITHIMDMNLKGGYIAQYSGELLTLSWSYKTMEEMIDATL